MISDYDLVGQLVLGHYRVVRPIARGGMGLILLARNEGAAGFVRPVVVKIITPDRGRDAGFVRMFAREARILAQLRHPGIVGIFDFAEDRGAHLMVLEYVHGYSLRDWARYRRSLGQRLEPAVAVDVVAAVAEALHYAHTLRSSDGELLNIVHRDVSPANVLIDVDGHVKLADFGIARSEADRTDGGPLTQVKGKFAYMAPELLRLQEPSPASDQFSCGVVLHEVLSGRNEFHGSDPATTAANVLAHVLTPLDQIRDDVPDSLSRLVVRATARNPADRFSSTGELAEALREARKQLPPEPTLAEATRGEFRDPRLAEHLGLLHLDELDRAWRQFDTPAPVDDGASTKEEITATANPPPAAPRRRLSIGRLAAIGALVLVVALGAAAVALLAGNERPRRSTQFVLIDGNATPYDDNAAPPDARQTAVPGTAKVGGEVPAPIAPRTKAPAVQGGDTSAGDALGRAFARRRGLVARCVEQHASDVGATPDVVLHFRVGTDGRPAETKLSPAAVSTTRAGACILDVARRTQFPAQERVVSFRIPLSFKRR